jgi:integrase
MGFDLAYDLIEAFGLERGTICCSNCRRKIVAQVKKLDAVTCQYCGHPHAYIRLKYDGRRLYIREDEHGRPHTYASAASALIKVNQQINDHVFDPREYEAATVARRLFENAIEAWIERKEKDEESDKIAPSTLGNYHTYKKLYYLTSKHLVGQDVREIRLKHLQLFYDDLTGSSHYRKNIMDGLYTFFSWLKRWGEISDMPTWPEIEAPIVRARRAPTREEQDEELARIPEEHRDVFEFAMEVGMRPSEACALMTIDTNPSRRAILVRRTYSEGKLRNKTKNQRREYWLVVSDRAWELVERNLKTENPFVFMNPVTGRGYKYKFIYRIWKESTKLGFDLSEATRHAFVTQLIEDGVPEDTTMHLTRHVDKRSLKPYHHPHDDRTRDVLNRRGKPRKVISIEEGKKK